MRIMNCCYLKIAVFSLLQLTSPSFTSTPYTLSTVLSIIGLLYVIYFPIKIYLLIKNGNLKDKQFQQKYGGIYEVYKEDSLKTAAFEVVNLVKKLLIAISLVFLGAVPFV